MTVFPGVEPTDFEVVVRSGCRLSEIEAAALAKLLSAAYSRGDIHVDRPRECPIDHSPEAYRELLGRSGCEAAAIRRNNQLVGVLVLEAPPIDPYRPIRKLSHMAFWFPSGQRDLAHRALADALKQFTAMGLTIVTTAAPGGGSENALCRGGMRPVRDHAEICWLLSSLFGRTVTRIDGRDTAGLTYVADLNGRRVEVTRTLYCADAAQGTAYRRHRNMIERQMRIQHSGDELARFGKIADRWPERGVFFLMGFHQTATLGPEDDAPDPADWFPSDASGRTAVDAVDVDRLAHTQVPRPGLADWLLWTLRMAAPVMLVSQAPRRWVEPILNRTVSELSPVRLIDLVEAPFLTDHMDQPGPDDRKSTGRRVDIQVDKGALAQSALNVLDGDGGNINVYLGGASGDRAAVDALVDALRPDAAALIVTFGRKLEAHVGRGLGIIEPGHAPVLSFRAGDFYDVIVLLDILGLRPGHLAG
jgi:hypothetical protein